jgi:HPt (histidine-containing phosphotransfer) domain-containing protein
LNDKLKLYLTPKSVTEKPIATGKKNRSYIDFNYLETISPENTEFQEEMINLFTSQSEVYMTDIKNAFIDGNYSVLKLSAHALKPMGSYIGIHSLTELVSQLEKLATVGRDIDSMAGLIAQITIILDAVKVEIQWLKENTFKKQ